MHISGMCRVKGPNRAHTNIALTVCALLFIILGISELREALAALWMTG